MTKKFSKLNNSDESKIENPLFEIYDNSPYAKRIIFALRKIMQQLDLHSHMLMKHYDITVPQIICLYEIYEKGAITLSVLSKNIHLSTSTLVGVVDRLEEKELVKRSRGIEDRRIVFIDITEKGIQFVRTSPRLLHNYIASHLTKLSESEQIIIANSLDLLVALLSGSVKTDSK